MKRQIRRGVFETNSSSTHSICISKDHVAPRASIRFSIGDYGWEDGEADIVDYLYTAILCQDNHKELLDKLKEILDRHSIRYVFEEPVWYKGEDYEWLDNGGIDHSNETIEFINAVLEDEDKLMRCLFGNSFVITGNDNGYGHSERMYVREEDEHTKWGSFPRFGGLKPEFENYEIYEKGN